MELTVTDTIRRETKINLSTGEKAEGTKTQFKKGKLKTKYSRRTIPISSNLIKELSLHQLTQNSQKAKGL